MNKITSLQDLKQRKENLLAQAHAPASGTLANAVSIKVAMATCGIASGAKEVMDYLSVELDKRNIEASVQQTGCMGYCYAEPTIEVTTPGHEPVIFGWVDLKKADAIIEKYVRNNELIEGIIPNRFISID